MTIQDDPDLLDMLVTDLKSQADVWKPSSYWLEYCERINDELKRVGLTGFMRNWKLVKGYGNVSVAAPRTQPRQNVATYLQRLVEHLPRLGPLKQPHTPVNELSDEEKLAAEREKSERLYAALMKGSYSRDLLQRVEDSNVGDPVRFEVDGRKISPNLLRRISVVSLLLLCSQGQLPRRIIEIGGGYGVVPEILMKYEPGAIDYFVAVDIPPIVYIQTQYLKALFPGKVVDYRDVKDKAVITEADVAGKILVVPSWVIPRLDLNYDLFYNSASFQEMEPEIVENYLSHVGPRANGVFVNSLITGHKKGARGQKHQISLAWICDRVARHGFREVERPAAPEVDACRTDLPSYDFAYFLR